MLLFTYIYTKKIPERYASKHLRSTAMSLEPSRAVVEIYLPFSTFDFN